MRRLRAVWLFTLVMSGALLAGCAAGPTVMRLDASGEDAGSNGRVWPAPQTLEVPRYRYIGQLTGETNFQSANRDANQGLRKAWSWLVGLAERDPAAMVLQRPQTGMVDARGRVLVTDVSRGAVFVFDETLGKLAVWDKASPTQRFVTPVGIAAGPDGQVYVADAELGRVFRLGPEGQPLGEVGAGLLQRPTGLARDAQQGRLFVADTRAHDIKVFDDAGRLIDRWGQKGDNGNEAAGTTAAGNEPAGTSHGDLNAPTHLTFAQGVLYVADTLNARIVAFDEAGVPQRQFGKRGLYVGNLVRPKGVAADDEGNLYVVESMHDNLLVFDNQAQLLLSIGGTGSEVGKFYLPSGVWVDGNNRVFVADMFNGRVVVFQFLGGG
jgi:DNA-binding beta-propeller fold protein YncE